jgi:hypothetical protein
LPPAAEGACQELPERAACEDRTAAAAEELDALLAAPAGDYSESAAAAGLERWQQSALDCPMVELGCLDRTLAAYGATPQTDTARKRVFDLLAERQRLQGELSKRTAQSCVDVSLAEDMPRVVESYRQFVRQPGEYFMLQLHLSFVALYRSENACLKRLAAAKVQQHIAAK